MCLVFRTIVLLSLNWWVISVVAQEKQDVIITGTAGSSQISPAIQAQQPLVSEVKKTEETKKTKKLRF